jgi:hypothetical protein
MLSFQLYVCVDSLHSLCVSALRNLLLLRINTFFILFFCPRCSRSVNCGSCVDIRRFSVGTLYPVWSFSLGVPWFRRLVAGLSPLRSGFDSESSQWDLWWMKWNWDRSLPVLQVSPVSTIPPGTPLVSSVEVYSLTYKFCWYTFI